MADDVDVMRSKVAYTAIQAHLGELVVQLGRSHALVEDQAWALARTVVDETSTGREAGGTGAGRTRTTRSSRRRVPHKALLTMRLAAVRGRPGDAYVRVGNPLHDPDDP